VAEYTDDARNLRTKVTTASDEFGDHDDTTSVENILLR
jgi:hypothetical protein